MNESTDSNLDDAYQVYQRLLTDQQSLLLATINKDGTPLASYTPYVVDEQNQFYIFVSQLAAHTANLQQREQVSLMLIEDEGAAKQIFARQRLTYQCRVSSVGRSTPEWDLVMEQYQTRLGKMVGCSNCYRVSNFLS